MELYVLPNALARMAGSLDRMHVQYLSIADGFRDIRLVESLETDEIALLQRSVSQTASDMEDQALMMKRHAQFLSLSEATYKRSEQRLIEMQSSLKNKLFTGSGALVFNYLEYGGSSPDPDKSSGHKAEPIGKWPQSDLPLASTLLFSRVPIRLESRIGGSRPSPSIGKGNAYADQKTLLDLYSGGYLSSLILTGLTLFPMGLFYGLWGLGATSSGSGGYSGRGYGNGRRGQKGRAADLGIGDHYKQVDLRDVKPSFFDGEGGKILFPLGIGAAAGLMYYYLIDLMTRSGKIKKKKKTEFREARVTPGDPSAIGGDTEPVAPKPPGGSTPGEGDNETPEIPETSEDSETPETAETPETSEDSETAETPETSEDSETPETPETSEDSETPETSGDSEIPETPSDDGNEGGSGSGEAVDGQDGSGSDEAGGSENGGAPSDADSGYTGDENSGSDFDSGSGSSEEFFESEIPESPLPETEPDKPFEFQDSKGGIDYSELDMDDLFGVGDGDSIGDSLHAPLSGSGSAGFSNSAFGGIDYTSDDIFGVDEPMPSIIGGSSRLAGGSLGRSSQFGGLSNYNQVSGFYKRDVFQAGLDFGYEAQEAASAISISAKDAAEGALLASSVLGVSPLMAAGATGFSNTGAASSGALGRLADNALESVSNLDLSGFKFCLDFNMTELLGNVRRQRISWLSSLTPLFLEVI